MSYKNYNQFNQKYEIEYLTDSNRYFIKYVKLYFIHLEKYVCFEMLETKLKTNVFILYTNFLKIKLIGHQE